MARWRNVVGVLLLFFVKALPGQTADLPGLKPLAGDATSIREGESLFRANCSPCHGLQARGGARGPDLTSGRWIHGGSDAEVFRTIQGGVPGTEMPANAFEGSEIWSIVGYLRTLAPVHPKLTGDAKKGERLFFGKENCSGCHMVSGRGGVIGPELTRVGAARSFQYLEDSIRNPNKDLSVMPTDPNNHYAVPVEWGSVMVVTQQGRTIRGVPKNEDAFTLQLVGEDSQLHLFSKEDLREVQHTRKSLMPAYSEQQLNKVELVDLLTYLSTLRGGDK